MFFLNIFFHSKPWLIGPDPRLKSCAGSRRVSDVRGCAAIHRLRWYLYISLASAADLKRGEKRFLRVPMFVFLQRICP